MAESAVLEIVEVRLVGRARRGLAHKLHGAIERHLLRLGADPLTASPLARPQVARTSPSPSPGELVVWLSERPPDEQQHDLLHLRHGGLVEPIDDAFRRAVLSEESCVETELLLRRHGATVVVERTVSGVRPFSVALGRDLALWKLVAVVRRGVERLPGLNLPASAPRAAPSSPSNARLIAHAARTWPRVLGARLLFRRPWSIRLRRRGPEPTTGWSVEEQLVRWKLGHLYADPFLFEHDGRHHLFCEEVERGARRGVISHTELRADGRPADAPARVLEQPYHLSYPFVFAHDGELFMIPETSAVARVELYRAVDFPYRWRREAILLDGLDAVDSTILLQEDRLWLFAGVAPENASSLDELHLFWAGSPSGPWQPHARNPVVSDVRCARPAGAIQRWGSRLVRPGQDGSRRYGGAISFREIDVLSPTEFAEHEIARLEPADVGARACHTYAADGRFEAIDLRRREPRLRFMRSTTG